MKQSIKILFFFVILLSFISFISAVPQLTINSPQYTSYNSTKILVNVTSNESVDFFIKGSVGQRNVMLRENSNNFQNYLYVNEGEHEFTIWANNSNGETNASVFFNTTIHNPVNVTSCGILSSSDTEYILGNNIYGDGSFYSCLLLLNLRNVTLDLNGYVVTIPGTGNSLSVQGGSEIEVFNGTLNGTIYPSSNQQILDLAGMRIKIKDVNISGFVGMNMYIVTNVIFENLNINSSVGVWFEALKNVYFINSSFTWNGLLSGYPSTSAFNAYYGDSEIFLENVTIDESFPDYDFYLDGTFNDFYLRNTNINMSKIRYSQNVADARIFTQHLIEINLRNQLNKTGSGVVEIKDNGLLGDVIDENRGIIETIFNPTDDFLVSTDNNGTGNVWLTEKLTFAKSSSPAVLEEYDFSNYTLIARSWDSNETIPLNLTGHHSTIPVNFQIETPQQLPACTISQMLDLTGNGIVDVSDKNLLQDYITGKNVSINNTKQCEGLNLFVV